MLLRKYMPLTFQLSVLITLPVLIMTQPHNVIWVLGIAWLYHFMAFSLCGHMIISHGRSSWIPHELLYTLFFYVSYILPDIWAGLHIQHHKHTDTHRDPQSPDHTGFKSLLALYDTNLTDIRTVIKHRKNNPLSVFFQKYYNFLIVIPVLLTVIFPDSMLMWYWVPGSMSLSIATLSAWYTHVNYEPRRRFHVWAKILFLGESELHDTHHQSDWNHCDPSISWMLRP